MLAYSRGLAGGQGGDPSLLPINPEEFVLAVKRSQDPSILQQVLLPPRVGFSVLPDGSEWKQQKYCYENYDPLA